MKVELFTSVLVLLGLCDLRVAGLDEAPVVALRAGQVRGTTATTFSRKVYAFRGIPYAKPPVGKRRLKDPEYLKQWIGVWNATQAPTSCLQYDRMPSSSVEGDEDCLYLSVFTPTLTPTPGPLPVIVYVHGGGFIYGSSNMIAPTSLLEHDVVFVTINYRLGPLGFLSTGDDFMPGNFGLKDQALALRWVRDNIAAFGGDPARVTLAGNSAGGVSVHYHYLSPLSRGLFARGISMSGCTFNPWGQTEKSAEKTTRLAALLGCPTSNTRDMTTCLRHRPARAIVEQFPAFQEWKELPFTPIGPTVEPPGLNRFLVKSPVDVIANGEVQDVPWMTGFTTEEGLYPTSEVVHEPESLKYLQDNWDQVGPHLLDFNHTASDPVTVSRQVLEHYLGDSSVEHNIPKLIEMVGDRIFKVGIVEAAKLQASVNTAKVHLYQYEHRGGSSYSEWYNNDKTNIGVSHADDILLLLYGEERLHLLNEDDKAMSRALAKIWVQYATDGSANWPPVNAKPGFLTLLRMKQNAQFEPVEVEDVGNTKFWRSLPIEENIETPAHIEL